MPRKIENLKDKLAVIMNFKKISQRDLALELGVNESQVSRWISGSAYPRWPVAFKIERLYEEIAS